MFRVSFYWGEAEDATPGGVPIDYTERAPLPHNLMMKGTGTAPYRCAALEGTVGSCGGCSIHPRRPSVCRDFTASYEDGVTANDRCDRARATIGLAALRPEDWWIPSRDDNNDDDRPPLRPAA
jgi:Fe-S-cluster containining protein